MNHLTQNVKKTDYEACCMVNITLDEKMQNIFETAQKMKKGEIKPDVSYDSIESFIDDINSK
jgi:hypothetical protein